MPSKQPSYAAFLEAALFAFLSRKYMQREDTRQRSMGLVYMTAETHDLAREIARFMERYQHGDGPQHRDGMGRPDCLETDIHISEWR